MSKPIIEVKGLSKSYKLGVFNAKTLLEEAEAFLSRFSRKNAHTANGIRHTANGGAHAASGLVTSNSPPATAEPSSDFWALRDVSFDVQPGEVIGVIGRNGAGIQAARAARKTAAGSPEGAPSPPRRTETDRPQAGPHGRGSGAGESKCFPQWGHSGHEQGGDPEIRDLRS